MDTDPLTLQDTWDQQQQLYLPGREDCFTAMIDAVEALADAGPVRILDLAGGPGSLTRRLLDRLPKAEVVLLDLDPVLLFLGRATLGDTAMIVSADLDDPEWTSALPRRQYDAILTTTATHYFPAKRTARLYTELHGLLRPGGLFINADQMPDNELP